MTDDDASLDERLRYVITTYLEYDTEDHLVKAKTHYDELANTDGGPGAGTWTFTWKDGLLTEANYFQDNIYTKVKESYEIAYNRKPNKNKYKQYTVGLSEITGTGPLALAGLLGKAPEQYIEWYSYIYEETADGQIRDKEAESLEYRYEVNEDGTLAKESSYIMATGGPIPAVAEYTYTYSPFGSTTRKASAAPAWAKNTMKGRLPFQPRHMGR